MTGSNPSSGPRAVLVTALLLATGLAGCASDQGAGGDGALYESFDAAMRAPGQIYEPEQHTGGTDAHLKLLQPRDPDNVAQGEADIVVLLFDGANNAPLEDADVVLDAQMPSMGHGATGDERDPVHDAHAVYEGMTTLGMPGNWVLNVDASLSTGERFHFEIPVRVNG